MKDGTFECTADDWEFEFIQKQENILTKLVL